MERGKDFIINNALTLLLGLPTIGSGIMAIKTYIEKQTLSELEVFLICILIIVLSVALGKAIWNSTSYKSYYYPWLKVRTMYNYKVLKKVISYERTDDDVLKYKRSLRIQSCANRLESVNDKYIWTGGQSEQLGIVPDKNDAGEKTIKKITPMRKMGTWNYFNMELRNHMTKGEKQTLAYKWLPVYDCRESSPFFSASTDAETKALVLKLSLGKRYANQQIICEEFRAVESDYKISSVVHNLDEQGNYTWEPKVKRFRHYRIRWSWDVGQPATEIE